MNPQQIPDMISNNMHSVKKTCSDVESLGRIDLCPEDGTSPKHE